MKGQRATVAVSLSKVAVMYGVHRTTMVRALKDLEKADLVAVERHDGRKPKVTILVAPPLADGL